MEFWPEIAVVFRSASSSSLRERLAGKAASPELHSVWPSSDASGNLKPADAGEEMHAVEAGEFLRLNSGNVSFINHSIADQSGRYHFAQSRSRSTVVVIVKDVHASLPSIR